MRRGDTELAAMMRKMINDEDQLMLDLSWDLHEKAYVLSFKGSTYVTEEEAQAIEEAQSGDF